MVLAAGASSGTEELDVDLDPMPREGPLVTLPAIDVAAVALRPRQPAHIEALEDAPDARGADRDVVIAREVHRDLVGTGVLGAAQVDDLAHHLGLGLVGL